MILFAMSQITLHTSLDTPQRVSEKEKKEGLFLPPLKKFGQNIFIEVLARSHHADHFEYKNLKMNLRTPPPCPLKKIEKIFNLRKKIDSKI